MHLFLLRAQERHGWRRFASAGRPNALAGKIVAGKTTSLQLARYTCRLSIWRSSSEMGINGPMKDKALFRSYLKNVHKIMTQGDAREESFYSALEGLINAYAEATAKEGLHVTTLPKKTEAGNPDFRIWDGSQRIVGYIEAKSPSEGNLQPVSGSEQLKRYRQTFPNLILTNFFEFRLYRDGELVDTVQIARPLISTKLETLPPLEKADEFVELLEKFFAFSLPKSYSAEEVKKLL